MTYIIQVRGNGGKWRPQQFTRPHDDLGMAIYAACRCDEDGIFPGDVRIVDGAGAVIVTHKAWFEQWRAAGMKDFRFESGAP